MMALRVVVLRVVALRVVVRHEEVHRVAAVLVDDAVVGLVEVAAEEEQHCLAEIHFVVQIASLLIH